MLINWNAIEEIEKLYNNWIVVDSIICDIPYWTTNCPWDSVIPFDVMWKLLNKIIKKNWPIVLFGSEPFTSKLVCSNINNFKEKIIWLKNKSWSWMQAKQKHLKIFEDIIIFSNSCEYTFNPQKWLVEEKEFLTQRKTFKEFFQNSELYSNAIRTQKKDDWTRNPLSIVSCKVPFNTSNSKQYSNDIEIRVHPTQKPLLLMEYLVKSFSNEWEVVLDFTMWSWTTWVACKNLNRKFIWIELDENYFNVAKNRINS